MFSRLPLRRCLHTTPTPKKAPFVLKRSTRSVLVASALATAFAGYQLSRQSNDLALDALPVSKSPAEKPFAHSVTKTSRPPQPPAFPAASTSTSSSGNDVFLPDQPPPSDNPAPVPEPDSTPPPSSGEGDVPPPSGEGESPSGDPSDASKPAPSGAFNPETGEINWDCPCLGGMAHGPCGPEFKEAFSCFVFSEAEPKGINCVDKFQNMQNCFRAHPEVYADEIMDDDEAEAPAGGAGAPPVAGDTTDGSKAPAEPPITNADAPTPPSSDPDPVQKPHVEGSNVPKTATGSDSS